MDNAFISAIDNHNIANGDESWADRKIRTTGEFFSSMGEGIRYGIPSAVVAGVNSILNTGIALTNFVSGSSRDPISTHKILQGMDDNLGKYYEEHTQGVEIGGFIAGSLIPGMAGVKAFQAAKAGFLGTNTARSSGLMKSLTHDYATAAKIEFASGNSPYTILNANTMKGLAQGFGNQVLEAAAFETAALGAMYKSPTLDGQSAGDLANHLFYGTLLGGAVGGILHGIGMTHGIKKSSIPAERELFPYKYFTSLDSMAGPELRIMNYYDEKFRLQATEPVLATDITSALSKEERMKLIVDAKNKTLKTLDTLIQTEFQAFAKKDPLIANQLFEMFQKSETSQDVRAALLYSREAKRITQGEALEHGEVIFLAERKTVDELYDIINAKKGNELFTPNKTNQSQGFVVAGNLADLRISGAKMAGHSFVAKEDAFSAGYDVFRNLNGSLSVNPRSKILVNSKFHREKNSLIVDFENGGAIVTKATAGFADLATATKPVSVHGIVVEAGDGITVTVQPGIKYNPKNGSVLDAEARYIWAQEQKVPNWEGYQIAENDLPMLERAYYSNAEKFLIKRETGKVEAGPERERLAAFISDKKYTLAQEMDGLPLDEVGRRLNVSDKWLQGEADDLAKIRPGVDWQKPRYARIDFRRDLDAYETLNANNIDGAIKYEQEVMLIKNRHNQNFNAYAGPLVDIFHDAPNIRDPISQPNRLGTGASFIGTSNSNYGSYGGWAQFIGASTNKLQILKKTEAAEALNPVVAAVALKGPEALAEVSIATNALRATDGYVVTHPHKPNTAIYLRDYKAAEKGAKVDEVITIKSAEVRELFRTHNGLAGDRQVHIENIRGAAGVGSDYPHGMEVWYAPPIDTSKYKYFAFVEPREFNLGDKKRIITAKDEATLQKLVGMVDKSQFRIRTQADLITEHKAVGDYEFQLGINQSLVDSELKRKGVLSDFFPTTANPKILDDYMNWHVRQVDELTMSMVAHKYSQSFEELRSLGREHTNLATSQFRSITEKLEQSVKDPYNDIVKTALNISRAREYQPWINFNDFIRTSIEGPINKLRDVFQKAPKIDDDFVAKVNKLSEDANLGTPFKTAAEAMLADSNVVYKPWLARGIAKTQSILSTTLLQLDFFNAINNSIATPIILSAEVNTLRKAIMAANPEVAGKLAQLMTVRVPESGALELPTTARLIRESLEDYRKDHASGGALLAKYRQISAVSDVLQQERQMLDELTLDFSKLSERELEGRLNKAVEFGKKFTGNKLAEEMTRFVSARVMDKITGFGIEAGILTAKEADEYIQLFVNRTQGNYLHSQRPIVFQGVIGQAISLFQTYQFNLMQQLFRYVGEGDKKSVAILLGLQGSIYGMQGLPAFNFINTHIVGNASGNTNHRDLHFATNTTFGKELGDWMLYGLGSNALGIIDPNMKVNLYSRGDINPRQLTVLPTQLSDVPIVSASVRFVQNLFRATERLSDGAAFWPTISQAVEHNAISRPLAGLAQVAQGYSTTNQGSLLSGGQDFLNIATLARVGGGKPFDEAIALDALYRINAYKAKDIAKIQDIGSALKTTLVGGGMPTQDQITDFAKDYAKSGGRIENFNRFFTNAMTTANRSQVNAVAQKLNSPFAQQLQVIMGGQPLPDFLNQK